MLFGNPYAQFPNNKVTLIYHLTTGWAWVLFSYVTEKETYMEDCGGWIDNDVLLLCFILLYTHSCYCACVKLGDDDSDVSAVY